MNNPPYFTLHDRVCVSAAVSPSLAATSSYSLSLCLNGSFLSLALNQRSFKLLLHGEGRICKPIVCGLPRTGYSPQARYRKQGRRKFSQKRIKTQKEAEKKLDLVQPSEDCLLRLFEEQPLRLQNSNPTFQCISQESDIVMKKTPRLFWKGDSTFTNSSTEVSYINGGSHVKPDFTMRLLEFLSGATEEGELNGMKLSEHIGSQLYEENFEDIGMERAPQSQVFSGSKQRGKLAIDVEKEAELFGETNECFSQDILDSHLIKEDIVQGDYSAAEETDFSSEFSDDKCYSEAENGRGIHNIGPVNSEYSNGHCKAVQSVSFSTPYSKGQTFISPRHLSRSSGSRSSPSRSSIPGLRSKYSKPDPNVKLLSNHAKPLCLLPNFEVTTEQTSIYPFGGDDATSSTLSDVLEGKEKEEKHIDFDWWDDLPAGVKSVNVHEVRTPPKLQLDSGVITKSCNTRQSKSTGASICSQHSSNQRVRKSKEDIDLEWSDSDEERKLRAEGSPLFDWSESDEDNSLGAENSQLFEWTDSDEETSQRVEDSHSYEWSNPDAGSALKEERSNFRQRDLDARDKNGKENGLLSANTQHSLLSENSQLFEWTDSDEETSQRVEVSHLFELSDSDAGSALEEERSNLIQCDLDARDKNGRENGLLSAKTQHSLLSKKKPLASISKAECGPISTSSRPHTWYNKKEGDEVGSFMYNGGKPFLEENQSFAHNKSHQLPDTVKILEVPSWKLQIFPHISFHFEYSYSEIPKAPILGFRDHFSPFGPQTLQRPWTGRPLVKPRRPLEAAMSFDPELERIKSFELSFNRKWKAPKRVKSREEVLGQPLTDDEITLLVQNCHAEKRQVNLGRDGLTHNMIHLIHNHWKNHRVCRIKCRGPPTLDMDNLCFHIEDKTGGQIIWRTGCVLYLFKGRHYNYRYRPLLPYMLYRPSSPVYPKLVPQAPAGLTIEEAKQLRSLGQKVKPLIKLGKNGAFPNLVRLVRDAFMVDDLVSIDYEGLKSGDYRKIGAKLKELVPCVLLSLKNNRLVLWRGRDLSLFSSYTADLHVETGKLATELIADVIDLEGSSVTASEFRSTDTGIEAMASKAGDIGMKIEEVTSSLSQESEDRNIQLHPPGNMETVCRESLIRASVLEQRTQTRAECCSAVTCVVEQDDVRGARSSYGNLDAVWDTALKEGVAVEVEGADLEANYILQLTSAFAEVAPVGPKYTNQLLNRLRLQGLYEKRPKRFDVHLHIRRETLPRRKRLRKQASSPPKVKRHPDMGLPLDALSRILHQK